MEHVDPLAVLGINIRPMLHKKLDKAHVSMKGGKMKGSEAIIAFGVHVQPRFNRYLASFSSFGEASLVLSFSAACISSHTRVLRADHTAVRFSVLDSS